MRTLQYIATKDDDHMRLSHLLQIRLQLTRKQISRLKFRQNGILVNHQPQKTDYIVHEQDLIQLAIDQECSPMEDIPMCFPIIILYETQDLIVVHKPSGLAFHPSPGHYYDTLSIQVDHLLKMEGRGTPLYAIGRLDKDTSGIAVFAKHTIAAQRLHQQREIGILQKEYLALVHGNTDEEGTITASIRKKTDQLNRMEIHPQGKKAKTSYQKQFGNAQYSLLKVRIHSGRTHQIRIHMNSIHHPIAGDCFYGIADHAPRLCLHAYQLSFQDPFTSEPVILQDDDETLNSYVRKCIAQ